MSLGGARTLGVVLAGGRSTRFGSEKAMVEVDGAPMVARVAAVLAAGCEAVAVNARPDSGAAAWARTAGLALLPDPPGAPDGPLAGVLAGLHAAEARGCTWLLSAPCDTPWLPGDMGARLAAGVGDTRAAVATTAEGSHPLCALWSVALRPRLAAALAEGRHPSVRAWLREVGAAEVRFADAAAFLNLNTPVDAAPQVTTAAARRI